MNEHVKPVESSETHAARAEAFRQRYGSDPASVPGVWNDSLAALFAHRSVRAYLPDALPEGTLEALIGAAQSAASSSNLQTWSVVAVEDPARRQRMAEWAGNQAHIATAPLFLVFLADLSRAERIAQARGIDPVTLDYVELTIVATVDAALAAQNAVIAAESLGLGTVYIGAIRNKLDKVAADLNLPPRVYPVFGLVVGRPDPKRPTGIRPRLSQSVVLHRETYDTDGEAALLADYDNRMHEFQAAQQMHSIEWTRQIAERVATLAGLNGREVLKARLEALGLPLK